MYNEVLVGAQTNTPDLTTAKARAGRQGDQIVSELHGRYYEQTFRENVFSCANQAAVTTTATLATTFTGLAIANPAGSGYNLVVNKFTCAQFAVGAAAVVGISVGSGAAAGSLTIRNRKFGGRASVATASASATIAAPILMVTAGSIGSVATTGYGLSQSIVVDLEGSLIIQPGYFMASDTSIATTTALIFSFCWEEVPI
jgi:hypothetical protein